MPFPAFTLALPVLHYSGGYIASAGGTYLAGTLSSTPAAAFVAGNMPWIASIFGGGALTGIAGTFGVSSVVAWLAPPATFLGLKSGGWVVAGVAAATTILTAALTKVLGSKAMDRINEERVKGGLEPTTIFGFAREIIDHLRELSKRNRNTPSSDRTT